jgi:CDP-glucose 4,6-dehydratase
VFSGFYDGKRVLITGIGGIKGSWLALSLLEAGARVVGIDNKLPTSDSNFVASALGKTVEFVHGDVTNLPLMEQLVKGVDAVFHLAAVALVVQAQRNPFEAYRSNTFGVATVLEALRRAEGPKYAMFVTTDKVYKPHDGQAWVETDPLLASGPYQVSKACAEFVIKDYNESYFQNGNIRLAVGRAGNVIVGGDRYSTSRTAGAGRIVPDCFEALAAGRAPEIFVPGFTRPYTYGLDIIAGYMSLMSKLDCDGIRGQAFNFGPYEQIGIPNSLVATKACELWGDGTKWQAGPPREEPFDRQSLNWSKSERVLGWRPAFTFYEALRATAKWYREFSVVPLGEGCMLDFNRSLIQEHRTAAQNLAIEWALGHAHVRKEAKV